MGHGFVDQPHLKRQHCTKPELKIELCFSMALNLRLSHDMLEPSLFLGKGRNSVNLHVGLWPIYS